MTILCPAEFAAAVEFAQKADLTLAAEILHEKDEKRLERLKKRQQQSAVSTLLTCFGYRARSDEMDNKDPYFPVGTDIVMPDQTRRVVGLDTDSHNLPLRETFIFDDIAPYSFFFREEYIDRHSRQRVDVYDRCWYLFPTSYTQAAVNALTEEEMEEKLKDPENQVGRVFSQETAMKMRADGGILVREAMKRRIGMCGGIIYHADYNPDGSRCSFGSWSTHT